VGLVWPGVTLALHPGLGEGAALRAWGMGEWRRVGASCGVIACGHHVVIVWCVGDLSVGWGLRRIDGRWIECRYTVGCD